MVTYDERLIFCLFHGLFLKVKRKFRSLTKIFKHSVRTVSRGKRFLYYKNCCQILKELSDDILSYFGRGTELL